MGTYDFYCPNCGYECAVAFVDGKKMLGRLGGLDEPLPPFETCECADCGGVMLKEEE